MTRGTTIGVIRFLLTATLALSTVVCLGLPASASKNGPTTSQLRARAAAIEASVENDDQLAATTGSRYLTDAAIAQADRNQVASEERGIAQINTKIAVARSAVAKLAVFDYVSGGDSNDFGLLFQQDAVTVNLGQAYLGFAQHLLENTATVLSDDEHDLTVQAATEQNASQRAEQALTATSAERAQVLSDLRAEQATLSSVNGQLATLVAEQAAAAAAAAAKAAAAASTSQQSAGPPSLASGSLASATPIPPGSIATALAGIRNCESSDDYSLDSGNGYYGAYQFSAGTWESLGEPGLASSAPPAVQDAAAYRLYQRDGFGPWPACAAILGLI